MPCERGELGQAGRLGDAGRGDLEQPERGRVRDRSPARRRRAAAAARNSSASAPRSLASSFTAGSVGDLGEVADPRRRDRVAAPVVARVDLPVVHVAGLGGEPVAVLDGELHRREGGAQVARRARSSARPRCCAATTTRSVGHVVEHRAVGADRDADVPGLVDQDVQPARRPAGDERDQQTGLLGRARSAARVRGETVLSLRSSVPSRSVATSRTRHVGVSTSRPPRYGRSAAGTYTEPSGCWWWSSRQAMVRATAHSVPFSVATGLVAGVAAGADVEPPGLEGRAVRGRRQLAVGALRREPRLDVELARGAADRGRRRRRR